MKSFCGSGLYCRTSIGPSVSVAFAGQAAYAELLHEVLGEEDIYVGQLIIGGQIIEGDDEKDPEVLADHLWDLHEQRSEFRRLGGQGVRHASVS